jgi:hypothetical protein
MSDTEPVAVLCLMWKMGPTGFDSKRMRQVSM